MLLHTPASFVSTPNIPPCSFWLSPPLKGGLALNQFLFLPRSPFQGGGRRPGVFPGTVRGSSLNHWMYHDRISSTILSHLLRHEMTRGNHLIDKRDDEISLNEWFDFGLRWEIPRHMMVPPDSLYFSSWKNLCQCGYYLHRGIIGYDHVEVSKMKCQCDYIDELFTSFFSPYFYGDSSL